MATVSPTVCAFDYGGSDLPATNVLANILACCVNPAFFCGYIFSGGSRARFVIDGVSGGTGRACPLYVGTVLGQGMAALMHWTWALATQKMSREDRQALALVLLTYSILAHQAHVKLFRRKQRTRGGGWGSGLFLVFSRKWTPHERRVFQTRTFLQTRP